MCVTVINETREILLHAMRDCDIQTAHLEHEAACIDAAHAAASLIRLQRGVQS